MELAKATETGAIVLDGKKFRSKTKGREKRGVNRGHSHVVGTANKTGKSQKGVGTRTRGRREAGGADTRAPPQGSRKTGRAGKGRASAKPAPGSNENM